MWDFDLEGRLSSKRKGTSRKGLIKDGNGK
jgi:hypothetical protein